MRYALVDWLAAHGLAPWLAPGWATMVALAALVSVPLVLRMAKQDGADVKLEARALALGYLAALAGGELIETLRVLPVAGWRSAGRAAYGGLIAGVLVSAWVVRRGGGAPLAFLDRLTLVLGASFACVRSGCFLAGCDYGMPTSGPLGVRFPAESPAALAHYRHGWVPAGAESLPVHATQLYEAALGIVASLLAWRWLRRGRRDGAAIVTWLVTYAAGRFLIELVRGDAGRGVYAGLSSAQILSLVIVAGVVLRARNKLAVAAVAAVACTMSSEAGAQPAANPASPAAEPAPPAAEPAPPAPKPRPVVMRVIREPQPPAEIDSVQATANRERYVGLRAWSGVGLPFRFHLSPYLLVGGDVVGRIAVSDEHRVEVGASIGAGFGELATHLDVGLPIAMIVGAGDHIELAFGITPRYTRVFFASPYFDTQNAFGGRIDYSLLFPITSFFEMGFTPATITILGSSGVSSIVMWEPRFSIGFAL